MLTNVYFKTNYLPHDMFDWLHSHAKCGVDWFWHWDYQYTFKEPYDVEHILVVAIQDNDELATLLTLRWQGQLT